MKANKQHTLIAALLLVFCSVQAQDKQTAFSLVEAQDFAVKNHLQAQNARLDVKHAQKQITETSAMGMPQINGDVTYQYFIDIPTQVAPAGAFTFPGAPEPDPNAVTEFRFGMEQSVSAGVTVNQLIFDGTYIVGLKAARAFAELSRKQQQQTETEIKHNVSKAYYMVLVTGESKKLLDANVKNLEKIHFETSELYNTGFVEKLDLSRLDLSLANLKTQAANINRQASTAMALLKFQMGVEQSANIQLTDSLATLINTMNGANEGGFDVKNRVEFQTLLLQQRMTELNVQRYRANWMPSLGAFFTHSQNAYANEFDFFDASKRYYPTTIIGAKLTVPIFGWQNAALTQQAKIDLQKVKNSQTLTEQMITMEVQQARNGYDNAWNSYQTLSKNLKLAEEIYNTTVIKYNEGVGSSLEMANAQTELLSTQTNYINGLFDLLNAKTDLDKALGN